MPSRSEHILLRRYEPDPAREVAALRVVLGSMDVSIVLAAEAGATFAAVEGVTTQEHIGLGPGTP